MVESILMTSLPWSNLRRSFPGRQVVRVATCGVILYVSHQPFTDSLIRYGTWLLSLSRESNTRQAYQIGTIGRYDETACSYDF